MTAKRAATESKTATIKQRRIDVYLPTLETKDVWTREAARRDQSISEMVFQIVTERLTGADKDATKTATRLEGEVEAYEAQLDEARRRIKQLEVLNDRAEKDLAEYRAQAFIGGLAIKSADPRLVTLLSESKDRDGKHRPLDTIAIRRALRITNRDEAQLKALTMQLAIMEFLHVIRQTRDGGYVWNV